MLVKIMNMVLNMLLRYVSAYEKLNYWFVCGHGMKACGEIGGEWSLATVCPVSPVPIE